MVLAMEEVTLNAVDPLLCELDVSIGNRIYINHLVATPLGLQVTAKAELYICSLYL